LGLHQAGQWKSAAALYEQVLSTERENASALHLRGVLHHQQGEHLRAVELISRAVELQPGVPDFHANLAEPYRALGDFDRAEGCCRLALRLAPDYPEALCNWGLVLQDRGLHGDAAAQFRRALELRPGFALAHNNLGLALRASGESTEAGEHFRRAIALDPSFAEAHNNLGQMLLDGGMAADALPYLLEAVRLQPNQAAVHLNASHALQDLGRLGEAKAACLESIRLNPGMAQAYARLGDVLRQQGCLRDALAWLEQAIDLEPANAGYWQSLAELHELLMNFADAVGCWERVLSLRGDNAAAHLALGWALQEESRLQEAREHYLAAQRLRPQWVAPVVNLGGVHEELGELAEAEAAFRRALQLQPSYALPHSRLANLLRAKLPESDLAALEKRLADLESDSAARAHLSFSLAHVLDARGDYSRAAACLREANQINIQESARRNIPYAAEDHERFVDGMLAVFQPEFFARVAEAGLTTKRPVFVVGLPRSGTTLIEQVLASHPQVHGAGELRLVRKTFEALPSEVNAAAHPLECVSRLETAAVRRMAARHLDRLAALDAGNSARIVDKMPDNYMYLGLLTVLFPRATIIHCRRDARDVALSCWMADFRSIFWASNVEHLASRIRQYRRLMDAWQRVLPAPIHHIDYEDAIDDLEGTARRLIAACDLPWDPACLEYHQLRRPVRTASVVQVRQPIYRTSVGRWKHYEHELADLFGRLPVD
jgi:tetratricopeptide (TPR) repeat protein